MDGTNVSKNEIRVFFFHPLCSGEVRIEFASYFLVRCIMNKFHLHFASISSDWTSCCAYDDWLYDLWWGMMSTSGVICYGFARNNNLKVSNRICSRYEYQNFAQLSEACEKLNLETMKWFCFYPCCHSRQKNSFIIISDVWYSFIKYKCFRLE